MPDENPNPNTLAPNPRVTVFAVISGLVTIGTWAVRTIWHFDIPAEIQGSFITVCGFAAAYVTPRYLWS